MPRLPPQLLRRARHVGPEIATLLPACRTLPSAQNELRWLREHVDLTTQASRRRHRLMQLCHRRGRGVPLQYLLGTQPFGHLDIKCRPGVLIPRPETEAYTYHLVDVIESGPLGKDPLNIIDFCTGTGCIPLLLFSSLQKTVQSLRVSGVDISPDALELAAANVAYNVDRGFMEPPAEKKQLDFSRCDVFSDADIHALAGSRWDVMVSNPPYISRDVWNHGRGQLGYSVRKHEPRLALVPGEHLPPPPPGLHAEDIFYARLLDVASILQPRAILLEVGDDDQARRVLQYCVQHELSADADVAVWRDWPDLSPSEEEQMPITVRERDGSKRLIQVVGAGNLRSIWISRGSRSI